MHLFVIEVILVDERMMQLKLKHNLGFMSVAAMYALNEMCKTEEEEMFYAKIASVMDQCPYRDALIVLDDINVGLHGSGTRKENFARSRRLTIACSWYQRPALHRWICYSNAEGVAKEIDHILVRTC